MLKSQHCQQPDLSRQLLPKGGKLPFARPLSRQREQLPMVSQELLRNIPLLSDLDEEDLNHLAAQLEVRQYYPRERIFRLGEVASAVYLVLEGQVRITTVDEQEQEVLIAESGAGSILGLSSMLAESNRQTQASAATETRCLELGRHHLVTMLEKKPLTGMDMLSALAAELSEAQSLVRARSARTGEPVQEDPPTLGERLADTVARFGGSWTFILNFMLVLALYTSLNLWLGPRAWDPYPFILLNLFLSMLASVQAPIIMMSQNRQDQKDRQRSQLDFEVNRTAEAEIRGLSAQILQLKESVQELNVRLRS